MAPKPCHQIRQLNTQDAWWVRKKETSKNNPPLSHLLLISGGFALQIFVRKWGSVRRSNTISIVQSLVVNGTAEKISPLSPEEHLRTGGSDGFSSFCQATVPSDQLFHKARAVCRTEGRGNRREKRQAAWEKTSIEWFPSLISPPFVTVQCAISVPFSSSVCHLSLPFPSVDPSLLPLLFLADHSFSLISREGKCGSSWNTN